MPNTLAQLGGRTTAPGYSSQSAGGVLPRPKTTGQAVGYAVIGVVLIAVIVALAIKLMGMRRD
jgi:hypothetical protein